MTTRAVDPLLIVALLLIGGLLTMGKAPGVPAPVNSTQLWRTAVNVAWIGYDDDGTELLCSGGSGGLVGDVDVVVTNAHVSDYDKEDLKDCPEAYLAVGYSYGVEDIRFVWFPASERATDATLDIAVLDVNLQVQPWFEGGTKDITALLAGDWPVLRLADIPPSIGDPVGAYGFPGIGGYSVTYTSGHVAGWTADYAGNSAGSMKVDLNVTHGSSGSAVLNASGEMVGLVAQLGIPLGDYQDAVDCSILADTNGDGEIDDRDTCVSVGGFINGAVSHEELRKFLSQTKVIGD